MMKWAYIILTILLHVLIFQWHSILAAPISSNHLFKRGNNKNNGFVVFNSKSGKLEPPKSSFMQSVKNTGRQIASKVKIALARPTKADREAVQRPKPQQPNKSSGLTVSESRKESLRREGWIVTR